MDVDVWQRVQAKLASNGRHGNYSVRNKLGAMLRGLLFCAACDAPMMHTFTSKIGARLYRYYVCSSAKKHGSASCPSPSVPAEELGQFVVQQFRKVGTDDRLLVETIDQTRRQAEQSTAELKAEQRRLEQELATYTADLTRLAGTVEAAGGDARDTDRLAELHERIGTAERRAKEVREKLLAMARRKVDDSEIAQTLTIFDPAWEMLTNREKARIIHLLIERIEFDASSGEMSITFRPTGIKTLTCGTTPPANMETDP